MYGPNDHWPEDVAYWLHLVGSWAYPTDEERALMAGCRPRREDPTLPDEYGITWKLALPEGRQSGMDREPPEPAWNSSAMSAGGPSTRPREASGTQGEAAIAVVGVVIGFVLGVIPGMIALWSYFRWRRGEGTSPLFPWFLALLLPATFAGILVAFGIAASVGAGDEPAGTIGAVAGAIMAVALTYLMHRRRRSRLAYPDR